MLRTIPSTLRGWLATFALAMLTTAVVYVLPQKLSWLIEPQKAEAEDEPDFDWSDFE